jgi:hypothetical protein
MLLKEEIKIGEIYGWDVEGMTSSIHKFTKTVRIKEFETIFDKDYKTGETNKRIMLTVECQQTGQLFSCGIHMLTTVDRIRKMYEGYKSTIIDKKESKIELYSYEKTLNEKTLKRLEDIIFQLKLDMVKIFLINNN